MQKETEEIENLIERNDDLENYFRNTIIPQLYVDADLILQKFTPPAMKQFTLTKADVGRSIIDIKDNFRYPTIIDNINQVIESNEILEKEIQTTDLRWYEMNIIPYEEHKTKKTNGVIITFVEITQRIKDLKELEKLLFDHETLLDTISHDIKTPLTSLILAIELFKNVSEEDPKEFQSLLKNVEKALSKMQTIISELTDARQTEYKNKSEKELIKFELLMEDVRLTLSDTIRESGAKIKSEIHAEEIFFSQRKLRSIIFNLMSNAIKFNSPGRIPEIFVKTENVGDWVIISVKDNGKGIESDKQEAIFSKYFRLENHIEGSGIGLYLVKEIVENSGGKILLESKPGEGSEFKVHLKITKPS